METTVDEEFTYEDDFARDLIWLLFDMTGGPLPPYLLEVVLRDGRSFFLHSPNSRNPKTRAIILDVYDFRAIGPQEEVELKKKLDSPGSTNPGFKYSDLHPLLSLGRLRCNLDDVAYCIEWFTRYWRLESMIPPEKKRALGFQTT
jgi:hypothetical protein